MCDANGSKIDIPPIAPTAALKLLEDWFVAMRLGGCPLKNMALVSKHTLVLYGVFWIKRTKIARYCKDIVSLVNSLLCYETEKRQEPSVF